MQSLPGAPPSQTWNHYRGAIVDKNARIGMDCQIIKDNVQEANHEDEGYIIKDGIIVICKDAIIPNGTVQGGQA